MISLYRIAYSMPHCAYFAILYAESVSHQTRRYMLCITGGGSAGHVNPACAVMRHLPASWRGLCYWIGSTGGIEREMLSGSMRYFAIPSGKLRRYFSLRNALDILLIGAAVFAALYVLMRHRPRAVFSKGGYVTVPVVFAAALLRIPVISHESDLIPGLATRINLRFSRYICLPHDITRQFVPARAHARTIVTGNPIRHALYDGMRERGRRSIGATDNNTVLFFIGGSLGSQSINDRVAHCADRLLADERTIIMHQYGQGSPARAVRNTRYHAYRYIYDELFDYLAAADIVISRAGANIITELAILRKAMILIPLPKHASRGEQIFNANFIAKHNAGIALLAPSAERLLAEIASLLQSPSTVASLGAAAGALFIHDGAQRVASLICKTIDNAS